MEPHPWNDVLYKMHLKNSFARMGETKLSSAVNLFYRNLLHVSGTALNYCETTEGSNMAMHYISLCMPALAQSNYAAYECANVQFDSKLIIQCYSPERCFARIWRLSAMVIEWNSWNFSNVRVFPKRPPLHVLKSMRQTYSQCPWRR